MSTPAWRTGNTEPRLLICNGRTVGIVDDCDIAAELVRAANERKPGIAARITAMAEEAELRAKLQAFVDAGDCLCPGALREILGGEYDPRTAGTTGVTPGAEVAA